MRKMNVLEENIYVFMIDKEVQICYNCGEICHIRGIAKMAAIQQ